MASYTGGAREASRIQALEAERAQIREKVQREKRAIAMAKQGEGDTHESQYVSTPKSIPPAINVNSDNMLTEAVVGLVSHSDYKARRLHRERHTMEAREALEKRSSTIDAAKDKHANAGIADVKGRKPNTNGKRAASRVKPSFAHSDSDEDSNSDSDDGGENSRKRVLKKPRTAAVSIAKNPTADDSYLPPDKSLEDAKDAARAQLRSEWRCLQDSIKLEKVHIVYSYWNGSGHRREISIEKGCTIGKFLSMAQVEFKEIKHVQVDSLMFIKEDLIIPHHISFYDLIVNKARGKSGPLFEFHAEDDIRVVSDSRKEKTDSHAGKVVERRWYERNRHIFPASRWELWDGEKNYGDKYTISG